MIAVAWVIFKDHFLRGSLEVKLFLALWFFGASVIATIGLYNFLGKKRISEYDVEDEDSKPLGEDFDEIIRKLDKLRKEGLISQEEDEQKKKDILDKLLIQ